MDRRSFLGTAGIAAAAIGIPAAARAQDKITLGAADALIVVDVQRCFFKGGALALPDVDAIVPLINSIARKFANVTITQDWHTPGHISFASSHPCRQPFDVIDLPYGKQVLWPDHCVQGTTGADLHPDLVIPYAQLVIRKGFNPRVDSHSAFIDADGKTATGLAGYLKARSVRRVFACGLATDFCVAWTAQDARRVGLETLVIEDASRGIDTRGSLMAAWKKMLAAGVKRIESTDLG